MSALTRDESFSRLRALYPWPYSPAIEGVEPFTWTLDGGGRHIMDALLAQRPNAVLVEFGSFMGGSAIRFLEVSPTLRCILCDPWGENLVTYVKGLLDTPWALQAYGSDQILHYGKLLEKHGTVAVVRNNLARFNDRCIMIQQGIPEVFATLTNNSLMPDIVYLDARKTREEFWGLHEAFPEAIITGDDWSWINPDSERFEVREFVSEIARARGATIYADRATFVVCEPRHDLVFDDKNSFEHQN
jgi:hypothetical protein